MDIKDKDILVKKEVIKLAEKVEKLLGGYLETEQYNSPELLKNPVIRMMIVGRVVSALAVNYFKDIANCSLDAIEDIEKKFEDRYKNDTKEGAK